MSRIKSQSKSTRGQPPIEFSSDESQSLMYPSSNDNSSMDASILEKLAEYIYDDESETNVLRRILYTGICASFPKSPGGECGPLVTRQEMIKVDRNRGFFCSSCQGAENIQTIDSILDEKYPSVLMDKEKTKNSKKKKRSKSRQKNLRSNEEYSQEDVVASPNTRTTLDTEDYQSKQETTVTKSTKKSTKSDRKRREKKKKDSPSSTSRKSHSQEQRSPPTTNNDDYVDKPQTYSKLLSTPVKQTQHYDEETLQMIISPHGKSELLKHDNAIEIRTSQLYEEELMYKERLNSSPNGNKSDGKRKKIFRNFMRKSNNGNNRQSSPPLKHRRSEKSRKQ